MGGAGQIHLGCGAVIGIGAHSPVHMRRARVPFGLAMIGGGLIMGFLLVEPLGLARICGNVRNGFLVWPFRHAGK